MKKGETDRHLIDGINSCKKYNLRTAGNVIIGLPGETFDEAFESIKKSIDLNPDVLNGYIFQPFMGTKLTNYAVSKGYLSKNFNNWALTEGKWRRKCSKLTKELKLVLLVPLFHKIRNEKVIRFLKSPITGFFTCSIIFQE